MFAKLARFNRHFQLKKEIAILTRSLADQNSQFYRHFQFKNTFAILGTFVTKKKRKKEGVSQPLRNEVREDQVENHGRRSKLTRIPMYIHSTNQPIIRQAHAPCFSRFLRLSPCLLSCLMFFSLLAPTAAPTANPSAVPTSAPTDGLLFSVDDEFSRE
jgi:hypothetical protein